VQSRHHRTSAFDVLAFLQELTNSSNVSAIEPRATKLETDASSKTTGIASDPRKHADDDSKSSTTTPPHAHRTRCVVCHRRPRGGLFGGFDCACRDDGAQFCEAHRLPAQHDCPLIEQQRARHARQLASHMPVVRAAKIDRI